VSLLDVVSPAHAAASCATTVRVTVAPEVAEALRSAVPGPVDLGEAGCAEAEISAEPPQQTVGSLGALDADRLPHLWVPDSSLWLYRAAGSGTGLEPVASVASSPVVVSTSRAAVDDLGWAGAPPTWGEALTSGREVAMPDLAASPEGIAALAAVRASLGGGARGENAVVQTVLAATRGEVPSALAAIEAAKAGSVDAPLVPASEQDVFVANRGFGSPVLMAVYPEDGSPSLDYPLVRVAAGEGDDAAGVDETAVRAVEAALTSDRARAAVRRAGFREAAGSDLAGAGGDQGVQEAAPAALTLSAEEIQSLTARLTSLAKPSRLLAVLDVSTSMSATAGEGQTRATLARDATKSALALLPDTSSVGLWTFASELTPDTDWEQVVPMRGLTDDAGGVPQRQALATELDSLPGRLSAGGTSLYDTTLGAVRAARQAHDPEAVSTVVIITDGRNEDSTGATLEELAATLEREDDPDRPVQVVAVGLGPDADDAALQRIADVTGGAAYAADDPRDLQTVLFDALRRRG
jgi:hypothetical protein